MDDLIERLAREAGAWCDEIHPRPGRAARFDALRRFAALVAEEVAQVVEEFDPDDPVVQGRGVLADAIRAKFKEPT